MLRRQFLPHARKKSVDASCAFDMLLLVSVSSRKAITVFAASILHQILQGRKCGDGEVPDGGYGASRLTHTARWVPACAGTSGGHSLQGFKEIFSQKVPPRCAPWSFVSSAWSFVRCRRRLMRRRKPLRRKRARRSG